MRKSAKHDTRFPSGAFPKDSRDGIIQAAIAGSRSHEHVSDIHQGAMAYAGECLLPDLAALAFRLRQDVRLDMSDGSVLEADPASPRFRTDLLLTLPEDARAWHIFICHRGELSPTGVDAKKQILDASPDDIITRILTPSPEEQAIDADPANWLDPGPTTPVERVGGTLLHSFPENGFATFRPPGEAPKIWWPDKALDLMPASDLSTDEEGRRSIGLNWGSSDPYTELRLLRTLSQAICETGLDTGLADRNAILGSVEWVQFGDRDTAARLSAGMRMIHDEGGQVTQEVIDAIDMTERCIYAKLVDREIGTLRNLMADLWAAGVTDENKAFDCNDGRDKAWTEFGEGSQRLHVENQAGKFVLELVDDGAVRILKDGDCLTLLETLVPGPEGLEPVAEQGDAPSIRKVRDRNGVLLSLTSVACQFIPDDEEPCP